MPPKLPDANLCLGHLDYGRRGQSPPTWTAGGKSLRMDGCLGFNWRESKDTSTTGRGSPGAGGIDAPPVAAVVAGCRGSSDLGVSQWTLGGWMDGLGFNWGLGMQLCGSGLCGLAR